MPIKKKKVTRKIQSVIDGDSFTVKKRVNGSQHIRIAGKNAPEKGQRGYSSAKRSLAQKTGQVVTLEPVGRSYGRTVAKVGFRKRRR